MERSLILFVTFLLSFLSLHSASLPLLPPLPQPCVPQQKAALLRFKQELFQQKDCDREDYSYPKLQSWDADTNCCLWDGVSCDDASSTVISLNLTAACLNGSLDSHSSLFDLPTLQILDLSFNDITSSTFPPEFGKFQMLSRLELHATYLQGKIPLELARLNKLVSFRIGSPFADGFYGNMDGLYWNGRDFKAFVQNATRLSQLELPQVLISSRPLDFLVNLSSLSSLNLSACSLEGRFPEAVFSLPNINSISLIGNENLSVSFPNFHPNNTLEYLDLTNTNISTVLTDSIGNLKRLKTLNLGGCNILGSLPSSLGNLLQLREIDMSENSVQGLLPSSLGNLSQLKYLDLTQNSFHGSLPSSLGNLSKFTKLFLSQNSFNGSLPSSIGKLSQLKHVDLSQNSFHGSLPSSLGNLSQLDYLDLSRNSFDGSFPPSLGNLFQLRSLDLSKNSFYGSLPSSFGYFTKLNSLDLSYNNFSGELPSSIGNLSQLIHLYIRQNSFHGSLPSSLGYLSQLSSFDLGQNSFNGFIPSLLFTNTPITYLNISYNQFNGFENFSNTPFVSNLNYLLASRNNFSGEISGSICYLISLQVLDLSDNSLRGTIPPCFQNLLGASLNTLHLQRNSLRKIPSQIFTNPRNIISINLEENHLLGKLPRSLSQCETLEVLNVGNNMINDVFPWWLSNLKRLKVLVLRKNKLYGNISLSHQAFQSLRVIDISYNKFVGSVPTEFFSNWTEMATADLQPFNSPRPVKVHPKSGYYDDSITLVNKGNSMDLVRIFNIFTAVDFSSNKFEGSLPKSIGELRALMMLNFSNNLLQGHIPSTWGSLKHLESLDLSQNKLSGPIPTGLGSISTLAVMSFANNQLEGRIPQSTQFSTQPRSSYEGNKGLCGEPLGACGDGIEDTKVPKTSKHESKIDWIAAAIGYGPGLLIGGGMARFVTRGRRLL